MIQAKAQPLLAATALPVSLSTGQLVIPRAAPVVRINVFLHRRRRSVAHPGTRLVTLPSCVPETHRHALWMSSHPMVAETENILPECTSLTLPTFR